MALLRLASTRCPPPPVSCQLQQCAYYNPFHWVDTHALNRRCSMQARPAHSVLHMSWIRSAAAGCHQSVAPPSQAALQYLLERVPPALNGNAHLYNSILVRSLAQGRPYRAQAVLTAMRAKQVPWDPATWCSALNLQVAALLCHGRMVCLTASVGCVRGVQLPVLVKRCCSSIHRAQKLTCWVSALQLFICTGSCMPLKQAAT